MKRHHVREEWYEYQIQEAAHALWYTHAKASGEFLQGLSHEYAVYMM